MGNFLTALLLTTSFSWWFQSEPEAKNCSDNQIAGAAPGGDFELINGAGELVTAEDVITGPTIVYLGYTFCPDICPTDMARNAIAISSLKEQGLEVNQLFISVDPERDTPEAAAAFARTFSPDAVGLSGSLEQVEVAKRAFRAFSRKQEGDPDYYLVDHSTHSYLVDEDGFIDFFRHSESSDRIAEVTSCWLSD